MTTETGLIRVSPAGFRSDLLLGGKRVVDSHADIRQTIAGRLGDVAAKLFAKPRRLSNGDLGWFHEDGDKASAPLSAVAEDTRKAAEETFRKAIADVEDLVGSTGSGGRILLALNVDSDDFVYVVDGRPILVGWGGLPLAAKTQSDLDAHHARTIGRYLSRTETPVLQAPIVRSRWVEILDSVHSVPPALLAAGAALLLFLLFLMLPRLFGTPWVSVASVPKFDQRGQLRGQIEARERALQSDVCRVDPAQFPRLTPPASGTSPSAPAPSGPQSVPQPAPATPGTQGTPTPPATPVTPGTQGNAAPASRQPVDRMPNYGLPVRPDKTPVPSEAVPPAAQRPATLAQLLTAATVIVVSDKGSGSGLFVGPQHILTNRHVVEGPEGEILGGNLTLPKILKVERVAMSDGTSPGQPDYALLKLKEGRSDYFFSLASEAPEQLQNVIAVGYPGIVIGSDPGHRSDPAFEKMREGDRSALPEVAMTNGTVTVVQGRDSPNPLIIHRASTSAGNSGGPLVDECGRVIGVNTFVVPSEGANDRLNYSLGIRSAIAFLQANGVSPTVVAGGCTPAPLLGLPETPATPPAPAPQSSTGPAK